MILHKEQRLHEEDVVYFEWFGFEACIVFHREVVEILVWEQLLWIALLHRIDELLEVGIVGLMVRLCFEWTIDPCDGM